MSLFSRKRPPTHSASDRPVHIALLGPSGSGKGTHLSTLRESTNAVTIGAGDLLRTHLRNDTSLGQRVRSYMEAAEMVPDELIHEMMESWILEQEMGRGLVFDGFPRTVYQARFLDRILQKRGGVLDAAIYFDISDEAVAKRLSGRLICPTCHRSYHSVVSPPKRKGKCDVCKETLIRREDDSPELIAKRLQVFRRNVSPVLSFYQRSGRLRSVAAGASVAEVAYKLGDIAGAVQTLCHHSPPVTLLEDLGAAVGKPPKNDPEQFPQLDLVLLGGPGSGKGTQAEQLCAMLGLPHIATGDLFRDNLRNETDLGKLAKTYMDRGELVPDDVTESMVEERLSRRDVAQGFVLDGFPRSLGQAEALTEMLDGLKRRLTAAIYIDVSDEAITSRLSGRLICRECQSPFHLQFKPPQTAGQCDQCQGELYQRDDDNPTTVASRLKIFHGQTEPLIEYYQAADLLESVDGEAAPAEVHAAVMETVKPYAPSAMV